jgi:hypothetical protein
MEPTRKSRRIKKRASKYAAVARPPAIAAAIGTRGMSYVKAGAWNQGNEFLLTGHGCRARNSEVKNEQVCKTSEW